MPLLLALAWAAQAGIRIWVALGGGSMPTANVDEIGYLGAARMIAGYGTGSLDLSGNIVYRGGYAALIAPCWLISQTPATVYRLVQVEGAVIGAGLLPLAYVLARRCGLARSPAFWVANLAAVLPSVTFFSGYALTDSVLPALVAGWLLACHTWLRSTGARAGAVLAAVGSTLSGWSMAMHSRGTILVGIQLALIGLIAARRLRSRVQCALAGATLGAVVLIGLLLNRFVQHRLYPGGTGNLPGVVTTHLRTLSGLGWTARVSVGQVWYQVAVTGGLAGIGLVVLIAIALRPGRPVDDRVVAAMTAAVALGIAVSSSAALQDGHRIGNNAFGRYLACVTPVLAVAGAAALLRAGHKQAVALLGIGAALIGAGAAVVRLSVSLSLPTDAFVAFDFPEPSAFAHDYYHLHVLRVAMVSLTVLVVATVVTRLPRSGPAALAALFAATSAFVLAGARTHIIAPPGRTYAIAHLTGQSGPKPASVALDERMAWWIRLTMVYEQRWPHVELFDGSRQIPPPTADLVFLAWNDQQPRQATWPNPPPGRRIVASNTTGDPTAGWVEWATG